jgi:hypothetical protein
MSSYISSIILDEEKIDKSINLYTKLIRKDNKKIINLGYILLDYIDDEYINLEIQYRYNYIKIYYDINMNNNTFIYLLNNSKKYIDTEKLKNYLLEEINYINKKEFNDISSDLFISSIENWFDHSYCDDVFL